MDEEETAGPPSFPKVVAPRALGKAFEGAAVVAYWVGDKECSSGSAAERVYILTDEFLLQSKLDGKVRRAVVVEQIATILLNHVSRECLLHVKPMASGTAEPDWLWRWKPNRPHSHPPPDIADRLAAVVERRCGNTPTVRHVEDRLLSTEANLKKPKGYKSVADRLAAFRLERYSRANRSFRERLTGFDKPPQSYHIRLVTPEDIIGIAYADERGKLVVTEVMDGTPGSEAGVPVGGTLLAVDGIAVESASGALSTMKALREKAPCTFTLEIDLPITGREKSDLWGGMEGGDRALLKRHFGMDGVDDDMLLCATCGGMAHGLPEHLRRVLDPRKLPDQADVAVARETEEWSRRPHKEDEEEDAVSSSSSTSSPSTPLPLDHHQSPRVVHTIQLEAIAPWQPRRMSASPPLKESELFLHLPTASHKELRDALVTLSKTLEGRLYTMQATHRAIEGHITSANKEALSIFGFDGMTELLSHTPDESANRWAKEKLSVIRDLLNGPPPTPPPAPTPPPRPSPRRNGPPRGRKREGNTKHPPLSRKSHLSPSKGKDRKRRRRTPSKKSKQSPHSHRGGSRGAEESLPPDRQWLSGGRRDGDARDYGTLLHFIEKEVK